MNDEQTSMFLSYRSAMKVRVEMFKQGDITEAVRLDSEYNETYRRAFRQGDRYAFHRATRRYLKALRALAASAAG